MSSFNSWTETILMIILFVGVFSLITYNLNQEFGQSFEVPFLNFTNNSYQDLKNYQGNATQQIDEGEVQFNQEQGITLKTSFALAKGILNTIWRFITGGFIRDAVATLGLGKAGDQLADILQILFFISMIFALLYLLFKVMP